MLLRRVARPLLAGVFIYGGVNALRYPEGHAAAAEPVLDAVAPAVDKAGEVAPIEQTPDNEMLVKVDAGVKIVAGSLLALNKLPRLASTALAASLVPTTLAGHRFWEEDDPAKKAEQQIHFLKNLGLLGGLMIAAADTEGKPSLGWRGRRAARLAATAVSSQSSSLAGSASELGGKLSGTASDLGGKLSGTASEVGDKVGPMAADTSSKVSGLAAGLVGLAPGAGAAVSARASQLSEEAAERGAKARKKADKRSAKLQKRAEKRRADLQKVAEKRGAELQKRASKRGAKLQKSAAKKWSQLEKKAPGVLDQAAKFGHDVADRASAVGAEVVHQAEGAAKDARKRVGALTG